MLEIFMREASFGRGTRKFGDDNDIIKYIQ